MKNNHNKILVNKIFNARRLPLQIEVIEKMCPSKLFFPDFSLTFEDFYFSLTNFQNSLTLKKYQISLTFQVSWQPCMYMLSFLYLKFSYFILYN